MTAYIDCWIDAATTLFSQALTGEPQLVESPGTELEAGSFAYSATLGGEQSGSFVVIVEREALDWPLMGEGVDQESSWGELLREVAESAASDLLIRTGHKCRVEKFNEVPVREERIGEPGNVRSFLLKGPARSWALIVRDEVREAPAVKMELPPASAKPLPVQAPPQSVLPIAPVDHAGLDLLLDVELEATLRFGCRELPLGQVLDLGPGDVVQLDRTVSDPVDLVVGDKIVARGEVVLVNGNFGLRVTEVASPRKRLESIRCLF
jgi:flagellar motor switch protein FliN/FliY